VSLNLDQSKLARIASHLRKARAAEAAGRVPDTIDQLREVVQLDPHDVRTLRHLGDLYRFRLNRPADAATWYARAARANEREGLPSRAIALWRIVLQCEPLHGEAHERIGALYAETGHLADARQHYERAETLFRHASLPAEAAIMRAEREALGDTSPRMQLTPPPPGTAGVGSPLSPRGATPGPAAAPDREAATVLDPEALDLAAERLSNGISFHHYGLHTEARRQLEELLAMMPEHVEARQLIAEVCRTLGDDDAAAHHLGVLMHVMRRQGQAEPAAPDRPPAQDWHVELDDPFADLVDEVRGDVERLVDHLRSKESR
jgi:tetratricopeptide (TPR) repeat protein